jgi:AcrR family transcriptional regulator
LQAGLASGAEYLRSPPSAPDQHIDTVDPDDPDPKEAPARERILRAAEELFAASGFQATPTSRIAERAGVPKGLVHYYFRWKDDLLQALVERLPIEPLAYDRLVVPGDVTTTLGRLVAELDHRHASSAALSHLLWREADTHPAVRTALHARFERVTEQIREVLTATVGPRIRHSAPPSMPSPHSSPWPSATATPSARHAGGATDDLDPELQLPRRSTHGDRHQLNTHLHGSHCAARCPLLLASFRWPKAFHA